MEGCDAMNIPEIKRHVISNVGGAEGHKIAMKDDAR